MYFGMYFRPAVPFVSLGPSVAFVPCVPRHSPCLMFSFSPRTVASGKGGGHPYNRAPPTPDADFPVLEPPSAYLRLGITAGRSAAL